MNRYCEKVIFSSRAYNAVISETYGRIKTETGGILLGHINNGVWYIVESIDPGPNSIFKPSYFEYDTAYVNNLTKALAVQYKMPLELLGLWHRHPGSLDSFSSTDDDTNTLYAKLSQRGAISGLVNLDPGFRFTMYHVSQPLKYEKVLFEFGDNLFPKEYFQLKYANGQHVNYEIPPTIFDAREILATYPSEPRQTYEIGAHTLQNPNRSPKSLLRSIYNGIAKRIDHSRIPEDDESQNNFRNISDNAQDQSPIEPIRKNQQLQSDYENQEEEKLLDLLALEEVKLDEQTVYQFDSKVEGDSIQYRGLIKRIQDDVSVKLPHQINFILQFNKGNPLFFVEKQHYKFKEGIFLRYVLSKINHTNFIG